MKKVVFIKRTNGTETPEAKAEALRKVGHLEKVIEEPSTGTVRKYYTMDALADYNLCAEVTIIRGRVVQIRKLPLGILRTSTTIIIPEFGNF